MKRYPLQNLLDALGLSGDLTTAELGRRLGMSYNTLTRARKLGLSEVLADRYACAHGFVPWLVWTEWIEDVIESVSVACANDRCDVRFVASRKNHRYCSDACRNSFNERKARREGQAWTQRKLEYRRRYYRENGDYERARQRRYDRSRRAA